VATDKNGTPATRPRPTCLGLIKPDVVLYEEPLDAAVMHAALEAIQVAVNK
jgi:NAD-dependent SIR2 family protein deacetylase